MKDNREVMERLRDMERRVHHEQTRVSGLTRELEKCNSEKQHLITEYQLLKDKYESKTEQKRKLETLYTDLKVLFWLGLLIPSERLR